MLQLDMTVRNAVVSVDPSVRIQSLSILVPSISLLTKSMKKPCIRPFFMKVTQLSLNNFAIVISHGKLIPTRSEWLG